MHITQGEIEQLTISKESSAVSKQCATSRIPITSGKNEDFDQNDEMFEMQGDDPNSHLRGSKMKNKGNHFLISTSSFMEDFADIYL